LIAALNHQDNEKRKMKDPARAYFFRKVTLIFNAKVSEMGNSPLTKAGGQPFQISCQDLLTSTV
jgi:hypothetical protein